MRLTPPAAVLVGIAALGVYPLLPIQGQAVLYTAVGLLCVLTIGVGLRRYEPARPAPWLLVGGGVLLWVLGDATLSVLDLRPQGAPFPSVADALFLSGYPAVAAGVALTVHRSGIRDSAAWQDAALFVVGVSVLAWNDLLEPLLETPDTSVLARVVALCYPVADLLVLLLLLRLVAGRGLRSGPYAVLALALTCYLVADVAYSIGSLAGTFRTGGLIDLGWLASYVMISALALHPRMVEVCAPSPARSPSRSHLRQVGLALLALLAPGLLIAQELTGRSGDVLPFAVASVVMFLLVAWRSSGLIDELEDLTRELRGREGELGRRATTDALTGLANRGVLTARLERDLEEGLVSSVALLDVDDFKHINDTRGHDVGDHLLVEVGRRLASAVGPEDLVARLGGDEFAVVSARPPSQLGASLLAALDGPVSVQGLQVAVAASIGVATLASSDGVADPLRHADIAMYVAKAGGGRQAVTYRAEMSSQLMARLELRRELGFAVRDQEFTAWLQPVVDLQTHRLVGFEALARWVRPGGPPMPPAGWLPAAEETGLVVQIDDQVLRSAVRTLVGWSQTVPGAASLSLSVNASGRTLQEEQVAERVLAVLAEEGLDPSRLVLEVTESVLVEDEGAGARLQRLREAGVRIALDDFGTGWSSLTYLRRFPVDVLKLDRSFVASVADGEGGRALPEAVLQLASALQLEVVAEGVETPEQAAALSALGCRTVQGFLFAHPAPAEELVELVRRGKVAGGPAVIALQAGRPSPS